MIPTQVFNCENAAQQPTISLPLFKGCRALLDTGAMLPTWIKSETALTKAGGKDTGLVQQIHTMTDTAERKIFRINISMGDIHFPDLPILLSPMSSKNFENIHIVLAAPMFRGMRYGIDTEKEVIFFEVLDNQPVRLFKLISDDGSIIMTSDLTQ